ncbi:MarR family transcriptional regulator [Paenibacillus sp. YPG26]|uniref:MarR family winged helix-turn-helix transcriptional regulator n=1 Tax=Paenibacillus sp. YPG26 TaxID=2878915 RepID=UPI00203ED4D4|nr:MarR family transcriptional regulator [Paenibacillus sp. YPG26]USB31815.1 MarR family transcriptional regulator [Paenibacillus sp. YPG26]
MELNRTELLKDLSKLYLSHYQMWQKEWNKRNTNGLSRNHELILKLLHEEGPQNPSRLAAALKVTTGGVTGLADTLVKAGLIHRTRGEQDRRSVYLEITDAGRAIIAEARQLGSTQFTSFFDKLSDEELQQLTKLYRKLVGEPPNS